MAENKILRNCKGPLKSGPFSIALAIPTVSAKSLNIMKKATDQMERLIQNLLDLSVVEAGHGLPVAPKPIRPAELISEICKSMETQMGEKSLTLKYHVSPALPEVFADPDQIARAIANLLGNALKFTPRGGHITIGARHVGQEVHFHVRDTGQGIPRPDLNRIFEPFWQGRTKRQCGIGLGLPIVKSIIEGHKGRIWAKSKPGVGSTFYFTLPVINANTAAAGAA